ncbi:MAG: S41 family peptidase [Planctomycetota bacterium]
MRATRDHYWRDAARFFVVNRSTRSAERLLFDDHGQDGAVSPDGRFLAFAREDTDWFRKGYRGSQASQIWLFEFATEEFKKLLHDDDGFRYPLWSADGRSLYYVGQQSGSMNLFNLDLASGKRRQLTFFENDSVLWPTISRDGSTLVFRHLFDLYVMDLRVGGAPRLLNLLNSGEGRTSREFRIEHSTASDVAFTSDGLEIAFISGGDLWVMDTELREPRQITDTPEEEREPQFSPQGDAILFLSDSKSPDAKTRGEIGQCDIWRAERANRGSYWWQNERFVLSRLSDDSVIESNLSVSPSGDRIAFVRGAGELVVADLEGRELQSVVTSWNAPDYSWSPDGRWMCYSIEDNDFNSDVWITALDGSRAPFNLSTHPDNDLAPRWSSDGRLIAFTGRRSGEEVDIYYVWLQKSDADLSSRDRKIEKAVEAMEKRRKKLKSDVEGKGDAATPAADSEVADAKENGSDKERSDKASAPEVVVDFDGLRERLQRISIPNSSESALFWFAERKLGFNATIDGKRGLYSIEFPEELTPKSITVASTASPRWLKKAKTIGLLTSGQPAVLTDAGKLTNYAFRILQRVERPAKYRAAFDLAWRSMRDGFYDERLGNRDWDAIRQKYVDHAAAAVNHAAFGEIVQLMLGELNASHLGFRAAAESEIERATQAWKAVTGHLGVRLEPKHRGIGWKVRDVVHRGPAREEKSRIDAGEIISHIDGREIRFDTDPSEVLNGVLDRDIELSIIGADGNPRTVSLRPMSFEQARAQLYDMFAEANANTVDRMSEGKLGYLHIRGMNMPSFLRFEEELCKIGAGKDGLVIDVRGNGGGSTADHLLTVLTQPVHAITVPRGGGPGYPQDRRVYATWHKPIVVLCNQDSFSNAEIFSHAIKALQRGKLIGVPTAGGVISTGGRGIMDLGFLRMPFRGWFVIGSGQDMELNGAVPDIVIWPTPGDLPSGKDDQLTTAVKVLMEDAADYKARPQPNLRKASERDRSENRARF